MVENYIIGRCTVDTATNKRKCTCNEGWSGDYCQKKICYDGYCKNKSLYFIKQNNVNGRLLMIENVNVDLNILMPYAKRKFVKQIPAIVMVILLLNIGNCSHTTGVRVCTCEEGYKKPFCAQKTCTGYNGCNNGIILFNRTMYIPGWR